MNNQEKFVTDALASVGIRVNGPSPCDPRIHDKVVFDMIFSNGSIGFGEAYMDGLWDCEALDEFFKMLIGGRLHEKIPLTFNLGALVILSNFKNRQNLGRSRMVADAHYDLPIQILQMTLDPRMTYSCGYWKSARTLEEAQDAKLNLVCRKLGIRKGDRVLDIGCGWGSFMGYAIQSFDIEAVGLTVSKEQVKYARDRYGNLSVDFRLMDYREFDDGSFDKIASIGMFEHVGPKNYRAYFEMVRRSITASGLFVLHTIWGNRPKKHVDPWIDKYIFPNGVLPTIGQIGTAVHDLFVVEDVHNFGADYDKTLMAWYKNFSSHRAEALEITSERFCRMWEYYLLSCAGGFRSREISVGQIVLSPYGVSGGHIPIR